VMISQLGQYRKCPSTLKDHSFGCGFATSHNGTAALVPDEIAGSEIHGGRTLRCCASR